MCVIEEPKSTVSMESLISTQSDEKEQLIARLQQSSGSSDSFDFKKTSLAGRDLSGANLAGVNLAGADLQRANLSGARLFKANLTDANMAYANLEGTELTAADLSRANLEGAQMQNAGLGMAVMRETQLFRANLKFATLSKADLNGADLRCAYLESARIREASLVQTDFTGAELISADISRCDVHKAVFTDANLRDANIAGLTEYEKANWVGADMRGIDFSGAYLLRRFAMDQNYIKEFRERSRMSEYIYYLWWISSDCGRSIGRWLALIGVVAILFAVLYSMVDIEIGSHSPSWFLPMYFSIVTMTTLGYGDVLPISVPAQIIVVVQVMIGYIMLGGLLSIFSNKLARRAE